jgi:two-component system, sensor histidine kinase PdtaS
MTASAPVPPPSAPVRDRLGARLAFMVALAMLPLGLLGLLQSQSVMRETQARAEMAVMGETVRAAAPEIRLIQSAQSIAAAAAQTIGPYVDDPAFCAQIMADVAAQEPAISLMAYVPLSGFMTCASTGSPFDFSTHPLFLKVAALDHPGFVVNPKGPVSATSVLGLSHPVYNASGQRVGFISISIPHQALNTAQLIGGQTSNDDLTVSEAAALLTFDAAGTILTATGRLEDAPLRLPADVTLQSLATGVTQTFAGTSVAGLQRLFAVVPIAEGLFLLGSWPKDNQTLLFGLNVGPYIFPLLMWLSAMVVALVATENLVTRHMRKLGVAMAAFTGGDRKSADLDLAKSPAEIRALGQAYDVLTATILRDEAELENMLRQKEMLLREVHHRTGNSLQLIASIMRMHMRQEKSDTVRPILDDLHDRVMGLATVHMGLYQTTGQKDVRMDELFTKVIRQIAAMGKQSSQKPQIITSFEEIHLIPDQAVPLALLLTELLSGLPTQTGGDATVDVALQRQEDGLAILRITGPAILGAAPTDQPTPTVIGTQLVRGFAQQIGGTLQVASTADVVDVVLSFPIREGPEV